MSSGRVRRGRSPRSEHCKRLQCPDWRCWGAKRSTVFRTEAKRCLAMGGLRPSASDCDLSRAIVFVCCAVGDVQLHWRSFAFSSRGWRIDLHLPEQDCTVCVTVFVCVTVPLGVCVCLCVCTRALACVWLCACVCARIYVCVFMCVCARIYVYLCVCVCARARVCVSVFVCVVRTVVQLLLSRNTSCIATWNELSIFGKTRNVTLDWKNAICVPCAVQLKAKSGQCACFTVVVWDLALTWFVFKKFRMVKKVRTVVLLSF